MKRTFHPNRSQYLFPFNVGCFLSPSISAYFHCLSLDRSSNFPARIPLVGVCSNSINTTLTLRLRGWRLVWILIYGRTCCDFYLPLTPMSVYWTLSSHLRLFYGICPNLLVSKKRLFNLFFVVCQKLGQIQSKAI